MDFVTDFPRSQKGHDDIFVIIDCFSKVAHFLPVKEMITASQLADLYVSRIVSLHGIPLEISSDRGSLFTSRFWESFQEAMGTHLSFSTAYHPQSQGQVERVNQVLEDMLRACVISFGKKWEESLPFVEFSYNNSYQASCRWPPLKFFMYVSVEPLSIGQKLGNEHSLVRILSEMLKNKLTLSVNI